MAPDPPTSILNPYPDDPGRLTRQEPGIMKFAIINSETHEIIGHANSYREAVRMIEQYERTTLKAYHAVAC